MTEHELLIQLRDMVIQSDKRSRVLHSVRVGPSAPAWDKICELAKLAKESERNEEITLLASTITENIQLKKQIGKLKEQRKDLMDRLTTLKLQNRALWDGKTERRQSA